MTILMAIEQWRSCLQPAKFLICTDQRSLIHLSDQRLNTPWQQKVFTKLLGLQYKIVYKQGTNNRVDDTLSRRSHPSTTLFAILVRSPAGLLSLSHEQDKEAQTILTKLYVDLVVVQHFTL
jgi:hypothetical protein